MKPNEQTAVLGGTFDPPHRGHEQIIQALKEEGFKDVVVFVEPTPPQKSNISPYSDRLQMAELAFQTTLEKDIQKQFLNRTSFTTEVIPLLRSKYGKICFAQGSDQMENWRTWKGYPEVLDQCHWLVFQRADRKPTSFPEHPNVRLSSNPIDAISSTELRSDPRLWDRWIHPNVCRYLKESGLYDRERA